MIVIGLTGSIGMGKSTTAGFFRDEGVPVHDADLAVHRLYRGRAVPLIGSHFPGAVRDGVVDRPALSRQVLGRPGELARLEALIHPLVSGEREAFLQDARSIGARHCVLDVPLLLEKAGDARCDAVVVVTAPPEVQRRRVLDRPGMTEEALAAVLARQMPDAEKRRHAHFLVDSSRGHDAARRQVRAILRALSAA